MVLQTFFLMEIIALLTHLAVTFIQRSINLYINIYLTQKNNLPSFNHRSNTDQIKMVKTHKPSPQPGNFRREAQASGSSKK